MKLLRNRTTIVLASVGAIGAIAAIATAASLALFFDPVAPQTATYVAGNVTLQNDVTADCNVTGIAPGYSTDGYPGNLGDQSGQKCTVDIFYTGSLDAFLALDVSVSTSAGTDTVACNGGDASGTAACEPLYDPTNYSAGTNDPLEVYVLANGDSYNGENAPTQAFGIGSDQTITDPGTTGVDTGYSGTASTGTAAKCESATGTDCPVQGGFKYLESFSVYVYWPLDESGQNVFQNSSATITLTEHAVQAADNALFSCSPIQDGQGTPANYENPDQPSAGWGGGFSAGGSDFPAAGSCPAIDSQTNGEDWTSAFPTSELLPFFHPNN